MLRVSRGDKKLLHGIESSSAIFTLACKGVGEGSVSHVEGGLKIFRHDNSPNAKAVLRVSWHAVLGSRGSRHHRLDRERDDFRLVRAKCKQSLTRSFQIGHMCPFCRLFLAPDFAQRIDDMGVVDLRDSWSHASDFFRSSSHLARASASLTARRRGDRLPCRSALKLPRGAPLGVLSIVFDRCARSLTDHLP